MTQPRPSLSALALSLALILGTVTGGIVALAQWDMLHDAGQKARAARAAQLAPAGQPVAPYTFDGARIVMR
jgi:hypothetical protein